MSECLFFFCRTVFILSEALDEQLKALWFSPFHTDDMETELDMVKERQRVCVCFTYVHVYVSVSPKVTGIGCVLGLHDHGLKGLSSLLC